MTLSGAPRPTGRLRRLGALDPLVAAGVALLLAFPAIVMWLTAGQPVPVVEATHVPRAVEGSARVDVRALPVFMGSTPEHLADPIATRAALSAAAESLLGEAAGRQLVRMAEQEKSLRPEAESTGAASSPYPYRYPALDRLLDADLDMATPAAVNDLAAGFVHAAALRVGSDYKKPFPQAGSIAFALLDRARRDGACEPQLNLAFLLSAEPVPRVDEVVAEHLRAARACPEDPTPLWLLGQFHSLRASWPAPTVFAPPPPEVEEIFATFEQLRREFPDSSAGWSGAADAELRIAYRSLEQPFRARVHFRRALALYREAERMDDDPALRAGIARAYAGLGEFERAVAAQRQAIGERSDLAPLQARLVEYLEHAGDFTGAATAAEPLVASARFPEGLGMYPVSADQWDPYNKREDGDGPLSVGTDRLAPVTISLGVSGGGIGDALQDISFIPTYHDVETVTGHDRWCPGWSMERDRALAKGFVTLSEPSGSYRTLRRGYSFDCGDLTLLSAIGALEAADPDRAVEIAALDDEESYADTLTRVHDARQNLWRFAGDLDRARSVAREWRNTRDDDPLAYDRSGEIEYLDGDFAAAREHFAVAVHLARADSGFPSVVEAEAQLKLGAALAALGRHEAALDAFSEAAATGSRAAALAFSIPDFELGASDDGSEAAYHALAQAGYSALRLRRLRLAVESYEQAVAIVPSGYWSVLSGEQSLSRLEVAFNNLSLAQARRGDLEDAVRSAQSAVQRDPLNPYSRATEGYALARLGRTERARESLRAAVRDFPGNRAAWNDLGVVEARAGRPEAASDALRRAVGIDRRYALGWFNLGVVLERRGPLNAVAAQGAFGRAVRADGAFGERRHELTLDDAVVFSELDLSKPLPARWSFAGTAPAAPVGAAGLGALMLIGLGAARALGGQGFSGSDRLLQTLATVLERGRAAARFLPAAVAVLAVDAVLVIPAARSSGASAWSVGLLVLGVTLLVALVMRARVVAARRVGVSLQQRAWTPAIVIGLATSLFGVAWAPVPVALTDRSSGAVHWTAPLVTGGLAIALFILAAVFEVPLTRQLAVASLVMTASTLTPVRPLDGGAIAEGSAAGSATLAVVATGLLVLLGLG